MGENEHPDERLKKNVFWLSVTSLFTDIHSEMIMPLLPFFLVDRFHAGPALIGFMEGIADGFSSILKAFFGWVSDRYQQRKRFVLWGYVLAWISKCGIPFAGSGQTVVVLRVTDRIGKGIRTSPRDALLAESAVRTERGHAFGFHRTFDTAGAIIGSGLAFILALGGMQYETIFMLAAVPGFFALVSLIRKVVEPKPSPSDSVHKRFRMPRLNRTLLWLFIVTNLFFFFRLNYGFILLILRERFSVDATYIPLFYLGYNVIYAISALPIGMLSDRMDNRLLILFILFIFCLSYMLAFLPGRALIFAFLLMFFYAVGTAGIETVPRALVGKETERHERGTLLGFYHGSTGFLFFLGNTLLGGVWEKFGLYRMLTFSTLAIGICIGVGFVLYVFSPSLQSHDNEDG